MAVRRFVVPLLLTCGAAQLSAQSREHSANHAPHADRDSVGVMAIVMRSHVSPALRGASRTETLLTQPMLTARGGRRNGMLRYAVMLNAERWTMPDGEPVAGIWGEGFIDRRHPHTVLHEAMLSLVGTRDARAVSISLGRGIVPFGTDDPMVRPFTKYAANHHWSQIMERLVIAGAVRLGARTAFEVAAFNGDEPTSPTAPPQWRRFGDSYAGRITVWARPSLELQGSAAEVRSPEFVRGGGLDQRKWSSSARWTPARPALQYLLLEWARTEDRYGDRRIAAYGTGLVEAAATHGRVSVAARLERTSRPEEERLLDPFRTARPPSDLSIHGVTQWRLASGQVALALPAVRAGHAAMFVEATHAVSSPQRRPVLVDPANISGGNQAWHLSAGVRIGLGVMSARVGRYGAAAGGPSTERWAVMHAH